MGGAAEADTGDEVYDLLGNYDEIMRRHTVRTNLGWEVAEFRSEVERRLKIADSPLAKAQMVLDQAQEISEAPQGPTAEMMVELRARGKVWDMFTKGQRPHHHPLAHWVVRKGEAYLGFLADGSFVWTTHKPDALQVTETVAEVLRHNQDGDRLEPVVP